MPDSSNEIVIVSLPQCDSCPLEMFFQFKCYATFLFLISAVSCWSSWPPFWNPDFKFWSAPIFFLISVLNVLLFPLSKMKCDTGPSWPRRNFRNVLRAVFPFLMQGASHFQPSPADSSAHPWHLSLSYTPWLMVSESYPVYRKKMPGLATAPILLALAASLPAPSSVPSDFLQHSGQWDRASKARPWSNSFAEAAITKDHSLPGWTEAYFLSILKLMFKIQVQECGRAFLLHLMW